MIEDSIKGKNHDEIRELLQFVMVFKSEEFLQKLLEGMNSISVEMVTELLEESDTKYSTEELE